MKKTVLTLIATLACSLFVFGQESMFKKGDFLISGITGASFTSNSGKIDGMDGKMTLNQFVLNGSVGYFIKERIVIGGLLTFMNMNIKLDQMEEVPPKVSVIGLNAYGRYYIMPPTGVSSLGFYGQVNLGMNSISASDGNMKASGPAYGGAVGANYFISEDVTLDCSLNYTSLSIKVKDVENKLKGTTLNFLVGVSFKF